MTNSYLVTGVSGSGKTAVARELARRGFAAIDADETVAAWVGPEWEWIPRRLDAVLDADLLLEWLPGFHDELVAAGAVEVDAAAPLAEVVDAVTALVRS